MSGDYEPFGAEWEAEMMKLPKKCLIGFLRAKCRELAQAVKKAVTK